MIQSDQPAPTDVGSWLDSHLPMLDGSTRFARLLAEQEIPFHPPVTVALQSPTQARKFAGRFEYAVFAVLKQHLYSKNENKKSRRLMATG